MQLAQTCQSRILPRPLPQAAIIALFAWAATGCHELHENYSPMPADGDDLPILRQVHGTHCHETRAMQLVIRDPATLAQVPLTDVPVDFSEEMLLVITLGRVPSDLYSVNIDRVWREGPHLRVSSTVSTPSADAPLTMASPYCIAVVPRCDLNIAGFTFLPPARSRPWQQSAPPEKW